MRQVTSKELQARLDELLDALDDEGVEILREGKPVARIYPSELSGETGPCSHLIGSRRGKLKIKGDIMSTGIRWDAES